MRDLLVLNLPSLSHSPHILLETQNTRLYQYNIITYHLK